MSHKATSIRAAVMGLGYAWYPEDAIREELERGAPQAPRAPNASALFLIFADQDAAGPRHSA